MPKKSLVHISRVTWLALIIVVANLSICVGSVSEGLPLYYWQQKHFVNFGDYLSYLLVERIVGQPVEVVREKPSNAAKKLLAIGSIIYFARDGDVVWGSGLNGKRLDKDDYLFCYLDVRAVRGPITRAFLWNNFHIDCPAVYGDPALLLPHFFPEFQRSKNPSRDYIIIPHYTENHLFPKCDDEHVIYTTDPWQEVLEKILDSEFVIASSLHGVIVAEAYGIPARLLRITDNEPLLKFQDYYLGTGRPDFQYATSVAEALSLGGEQPFKCDLESLYQAFPFEFWPDAQFKHPNFAQDKSAL